MFTEILNKDLLASQPTISRFWNRMDETTLAQPDQIAGTMRDIINSIRKLECMQFDLDSTLLPTYGSQEGEAFNYHYQAHGYHPLLCYDGLTGDLLKSELRDGTRYCSLNAEKFMLSLILEYRLKYPSMPLYMRGNSGFASPKLYDTCEDNDCEYSIRLKENAKLRSYASYADEAMTRATKYNAIDYAVEYGDFYYQANTWRQPRRVVFKVEKPSNQMMHLYTFIVTSMKSEPYQVVRFYCNRGNIENMIKEGKSGFDFSAVSSSSKAVNANRLAIHTMAYNLLNWFRNLALPAAMRRLRIDAIRIKLLNFAARVIHSAIYKIFQLCSSCPYKKSFT